jgi:uncharacterized protein
MRRIFFLIVLVFFGVTNLVKAQKIELINSSELIKKGIEQHDQQKYQDAINLYKKVSRNDTNYAWALAELALTYNSKKEYLNAIEVCKKGMDLKSEFDYNYLSSYGTALDNLKRSDEAIEIFNQAIIKFPYNFELYFNRGITYYKEDKFKEAVKDFQKTIELNYYYASPHFHLGMICAKHGKYAQAMLCLETFLMIESNSSRSQEAINALSKISNASFEIVEKADQTIDFEENNYSELNLLINSKVALDKKYKTIVKEKDPIINQTQLLSEKIEVNDATAGFWTINYAKIFKKQYDQKLIAPFTYIIFTATSDSRITSWLKSNKSATTKYYNFLRDEIIDLMKYRTILTDGSDKGLQHWFFEQDHRLQAIGKFIKQGKNDDFKTGKWTYYYRSGNIDKEGSYDESGKKIGEWKTYFENGKLHEILKFENDILEGDYHAFYDNGKPKYDFVYKNDKINGKVVSYNKTGSKAADLIFVDDKKEGKAVRYFENGNIRANEQYKDNEYNGLITSFFSDGDTDEVIGYINGKKDGEYRSYNNDKILIEKGNYKLDKPVGEWRYYYNSGKAKTISNYDQNGKITAKKMFFENGKVSENNSFKSGNYDGKQEYFDKDGKLYNIFEYSNDRLQKISYFDKEGKLFFEQSKKGGTLNFKHYSPYGALLTEGNYDIDGQKIGEWKYYYNCGKLKEIENYVKGELNGKCIQYYKNGQIKEDGNYLSDKADGYFMYFYENGSKKSEGWYKDDNKEGDWIDYSAFGAITDKNYYIHDDEYGYQENYNCNGTKCYEYYIKDDIITKYIYFDTLGNIVKTTEIIDGNGPYKGYFFNGLLKSEGNYKFSHVEGTLAYYYPDGKIKSTENRFYNKRTGSFTAYYENGKVEQEGYYNNNNPSGTWKWYHDNGQLQKTGSYKDGDKDGKWTWYYDNGKVELEKVFEDGDDNGEAIYYDKLGNVRLKKIFRDGVLVAYTYLDKNGSYLPDIPIEKETVKITGYFKNGNKSFEQEYINGFLEGKAVSYYFSGGIYEYWNYKNDEVDGKDITYYENGKLQSECSYTFGWNNGESRYYNLEGKLERIENYFNGDKHGNWYYYKDGKIVKTEKYLFNYKF